MTPDEAAKLRAPFDAGVIGKLPKLTCKACSDRNCQEHRKQKCSTCGNYISTAHIHLDYVGHAATTDRLLQVDPEWTWEFVPEYPMTQAGLWIKLTICGVSRYGFGDGKNPKEMIGDAIRNAAMRFGVALDLWSKEDLHYEDSGSPAPTSEPGAGPSPSPAGDGPAWSVPANQLQRAQERAAALVAEGKGARMVELRTARLLPKLSDKINEEEFGMWIGLLDEMEGNG